MKRKNKKAHTHPPSHPVIRARPKPGIRNALRASPVGAETYLEPLLLLHKQEAGKEGTAGH